MSKYGEASNYVADVWRLSSAGNSQRGIAEILGIPRTTVQGILSRPRPVAGGLQAMLDEFHNPSTERLEGFRVYVETHYDETSATGWDNW